MKYQVLLIIAAISFKASAYANQVELINGSSKQPIDLTYAIAYKNSNTTATNGTLHHIQLRTHTLIFFGLHDYQFAGVVPISINGYVLPKQANAFAKPDTCSLATDRHHLTGSLTMRVKTLPNGHFELRCDKVGGIFK